ncbi:MAG: hypothetical protein HQK76_19830, partial [Desulfobacterales bacterium]|nr:hypothetical protein [Desulfobacterales bacterium]
MNLDSKQKNNLNDKHTLLQNISVSSESRCDKILSLCTFARNDNYGGNFFYKLETTINYISRNISVLNLLDSIEIVIVDWNSEVKLSDDLNLTPEAWKLCKFIYVPPEIAMPRNPSNRNFNSSCINVALRRACGKYLLLMGADTLLPLTSLKNLIELLNRDIQVNFNIDKSHILIKRKKIHWQFIEKKPDLKTIDDFLLKNSYLLNEGQFWPGLSANMGCILMHRTLWHECQGCDERLIRWGWADIELGLRINLKYPCIELSSFGICSYEMDINPENRNKNAFSNMNPFIINTSFKVNDKNWGLGNENIETYICIPKPKKEEESIKATSTVTKSDFIHYLSNKNLMSKILKIFGEDLVNNKEWTILYLLYYYIVRYKPYNYLEFGFGKNISSLVVASCDPSIEIFGINDWQGDEASIYPNDISLHLRNKFNYTGNLRFITGDLESAFQRLTESYDNKIFLNVVYFRADLFPNTYLNQLKSIIPFISDGGALIIYAVTSNLFVEIDNYFMSIYPKHIYIKLNDSNSSIFINKYDLSTNLPKKTKNCSELYSVIPPEIVKNDGFYEAIKKIASSEDIKTILEIGSSSGEGSTKAF